MLPTYVVHAKSLKARKRHIERQMKAAGLSFEWITDCDPGEITPEIDAAVFAADCDMPLAAKSCALKHVEAFRRIAAGDAGMAMVLEDDAVFDGGFAARLAAILSEAATLPGLFSIQLGAGANYYTPAERLEPRRSLYEGPHVRHTEAYIVGRHEAAAYLDWIARHKLSREIDHGLDVMNRELGIAVFWAEPPPVIQGSITGRFRSAITYKSRLRSAAGFRWKRFWRFTMTRGR